MTELFQHTGEPPRITVLMDSSNELVRKRFHCPVCGKVSFEYFGSLRGLVPGSQNEESSGAMVVIHCRGRMPEYALDETTGELVLVPGGKYRECNAQFYV